MTKSLSFLAAGALALAAASVQAQSAKFVLFGDNNADGQAQASADKFVHPVTSPYFHEDSFVTSDVRAWYLYHNFPSKVLGGDAHVAALQVRLAITQDFQLVAYKDGYTWMNDDAIDDSGWNDVAAGLKWSFLHDYKNNFHAAVGAGYEFPFGESKVLHNNEEFRFWGSVNKGFGPLHLGATGNLFFAPDSAQGDYFSWHVHADYFLCEFISPVVELNGYHYFDEADGAGDVSGIDVTNLGGGDAVITLGLGAEIRPMKDVPLGIRGAYEFPLTDETDLYGWRLTFSAVYSF